MSGFVAEDDGFDEHPPVAVEQWYDRSVRSWTTRWVDADGAQTGAAAFDGHRDAAAASRRYYQGRLDRETSSAEGSTK